MERCTSTRDATRALAASIAALARGGDLLLLVGDLGAGKTTFTQGFAAALGVGEQVTSPTFTLVRSYDGRVTLHHLDVYRLERLGETLDLALGELLDDEHAVTLVEWGDAVLAALPADFLEVRIELGEGDDDRRITLRMVGPSWAARWERLRAATEAWAC
ncbi:MAG TPA: tRNA (adenosine(37)-N6)-threonylcarbamoyltransferase complex ATPase subunit type 1 TsaE [Acidimicrobiales bacterium]